MRRVGCANQRGGALRPLGPRCPDRPTEGTAAARVASRRPFCGYFGQMERESSIERQREMNELPKPPVFLG